jgi:branched-subunit amino acid transport system permease
MLVIATALVVLYAFVTTRTVIGRQIYAVGGNAKAAKLFGIKTERLPTVTAKRPLPEPVYLFLISRGMPFAYERPLCARSGHSRYVSFGPEAANYKQGSAIRKCC